LVTDPWIEASKKYKVGTVIEGDVNRVTPFGAFIKLDDEINGLIHVTEISGDEEVTDATTSLKAGDHVKAKIISIDVEEHRVALSIKALTEKSSKKKASKEDDENEKSAEGEKEKKAKKTKKEKEESVVAEEE
ncbi:MAG: S1 RNA-binding domain-containing protein, partial [Candidatus Gracilibacteria bacterium]|nr:S1 RNA-binding domain-containing protein [Candidatus Gracilibacteria bacterium]